MGKEKPLGGDQSAIPKGLIFVDTEALELALCGLEDLV